MRVARIEDIVLAAPRTVMGKKGALEYELCTPDAQAVELEDELEAAEWRWASLLCRIGLAKEDCVRHKESRRKSPP